MKRVALLLTGILLSTLTYSQNDYFFPQNTNLNSNIPSPEEFLGYPVGEFHTRHDLIVGYLRELSEKSDRVQFDILGYTNEHRAQAIVYISTPENLSNLETIRTGHLEFISGGSGDSGSMPVITLLGYNVHGNEPSSSEAAMLTAYWLAAGEGEEMESILANSVIIVDPTYNPDGRDRHTNWANSRKGNPKVADPIDTEHNETWPGGRTNHYWFDLNRDWLPLAQVESQNRMNFYHKWLPNVATDFHEMGTNATYFFEPTEPYGSENPVVPRSNYDKLNNVFADYYEKALNDIGSLYFTKEVFDNSYPGYGSTYPDIHGGLGMVFEQASSRGHVQQSSTLKVEFRFTIRNHLRSSLATVQAAHDNRTMLLDHQREFFSSAVEEGRKSAIKGYVFGDNHDINRTRLFVKLLNDHNIEVFKPEADINMGGRNFPKETSYVVPTAQRQYRMVRTMFEKVTTFYDSVFYDASSWTVALAYGMPYEEIKSTPRLGEQVTSIEIEAAQTPEKSQYAYLVDWTEYNSPAALYRLLEAGINVKVSSRMFRANSGTPVSFGPGTLMISVQDQTMNGDDLHTHMTEVANMGINVHPVNTGRNLSGPDLGSGSFRTARQPKALMIVGEGVSGYEAGEVWHLLDTKIGMPITKVDILDFRRVDLKNYNTLIMVSGGYGILGDAGKEKIKQWTRSGGTLIAIRNAVRWAINNEVVSEKFVENEEEDQPRTNFVMANEISGSKRIGGSIYKGDLDVSHPVGYGYTRREIYVYRNHAMFLEPSENPYSTVVKYTSDPLLGGYINKDNLERVKNTASLVVSQVGRGRAVLMLDNPNFRGFWYGTNRLFLNSVFFGNLIYVP